MLGGGLPSGRHMGQALLLLPDAPSLPGKDAWMCLYLPRPPRHAPTPQRTVLWRDSPPVWSILPLAAGMDLGLS